ncbi:MAG: tetratricopeptide repeat protein [Dysgonomonas sp.]
MTLHSKALSQDKNNASSVEKDIKTINALIKQVNKQTEVLSDKADYDLALSYLKEAAKLSEKLDNYDLKYKVYFQYGTVLFKSGNYDIALDYLFKALKLLDQEKQEKGTSVDILKKMDKTYILMGLAYWNVNNWEKSLSYFNKSLEIIEEQEKNHCDTFYVNDRKCLIYNNIGSAYLNDKRYTEAQKYLNIALTYSKKLNNTVYASALYNNLGIISLESSDMEKAFDYYNQALQLREAANDSLGMAQTYNNLGKYYFLQKDYPKSISYAQKALEIGHKHKASGIRSEMLAANLLSEAYAKMNDPVKALKMFKTYSELNDSIKNTDKIQYSIRLELQYQFDKQHREDELRQQIALGNKERQILIYTIVIGSLICFIAILVLAYRNQRNKAKHAKVEKERLLLEQENFALETQNLLLEKKQLEQDIDIKNKELTTYVIYLSQKNEFIDSITQKLVSGNFKMNKETSQWIDSIASEMKHNIEGSTWNEFEVRFQQVNKDFYLKLNQKYPDLTTNERRLCAFLYLNMSSKDIASITFQSLKSLEVARSRLRKKMNLDRDENLTSVLQQL